MPLYRRKPVTVEAMVLDGRTVEVARWLAENGAAFHVNTHPTDAFQYVLYIETPEGTMRAKLGDYIIKGSKGEFYTCKPDIFEATYTRVDYHPDKESNEMLL